MKLTYRRSVRLGAVALIVGLLAIPLHGQNGGGAKAGEWPTYGGDLRSTRYSPLDQINPTNFDKLEVAWRFKTENFGPTPEFQFQSTPLVVNGTMYVTAGTRRAVVAINAATGELKWIHSLDEGERGAAAPRRLSGRGLAYWTDGSEERILYVTPGYQLIALDAKSGRRMAGFGTDGIIDLKLGDDQEMDPVKGDVGLHAAPIVSKNVIIVGAAHSEGSAPKRVKNERGYVRGFDVRTGKRLWIFHTIPEPGEFGYETWGENSASATGNTGVWAQMTVDEELGLLYMPVELATGDYYGGHRPGNALFTESLVAIDVQTGKRKWHYQLVHHGIWDYDIPCAPILADLMVDGKAVKAVAQITKQGWVYMFDRVTGTPVWPIEERKVEKGNVPREWYSPTQPFVTKPPAFERQGVTIDDLIDFTPELRAEAVKFVQRFRIGPMFTPPPVSTWEGPLGLLMMPSNTGGANWQGGSLDPETNLLYVYSSSIPSVVGLLPPDPKDSDMAYVRKFAQAPDAKPGASGAPPLTIQGLPLIKPPYGTITALDLNKGTKVWQIAHGDTPDNVKNHPLLKGMNIPRTGRQGRIGVLTTKTMVIAGEGQFATTPTGRGAMLRAYDKATGADVGAVYMPAPQTGSPITYMLEGKQYITVPISGPGFAGELITFTLPKQSS